MTGTGTVKVEGGCKDDVKRRRTAEASRLSRAKKRKEMEELKTVNKRLKDEREGFIAKINQLQSQVDNKISSRDVDIIKENSMLKMEIEMHKCFIDSFVKLAKAPSSLSGQRALCKEGAECAQAYVQALIAESQNNWNLLQIPEKYPIPLEDFMMHYSFRKNFFGIDDGSNMQRFNLRLDMTFPGVKAEKIANYYWEIFNSSEEQQRLLGLKALELELVDMPDKDTRLMYNRKTWNTPQHSPEDISYSGTDQDVVFICNRKESEMPTSSLQPPKGAARNAPETISEQENVEQFLGKTKALTIAVSSTRSTHETMQSYIKAKHDEQWESKVGTPDSDKEVRHIMSVISQGALCWDDPARGGARLIAVLSYPEVFRWLDFSFADLVQKNGEISVAFAHLILGITMRLSQVIYGPK